MSRKRGKGGGGDEGGNWMDTYGDLVTLLLTFFVLLYSMSSLDQSKWELFVKSIYPGLEDKEGEAVKNLNIDGKVDATSNSSSTVVMGSSTYPKDVISSDTDINTLYIRLATEMDQNGISDVSVTRGDDYTFVEFKDHAFFDGDSSVLTSQGKTALDIFCQVLAPEKDQISQIDIMGHTAVAQQQELNTPRGDRMLASMRSAEVCIYIQEKNVIEPQKLVSMEYGEFRPVADNSTEEGRAANRRVEILLIDKDAQARNPDDYISEVQNNKDQDTTAVTDGNPDTDVQFGKAAVATTVNS